MPLDLNVIRSKFPALAKPHIYFDNPAGVKGLRVLAVMTPGNLMGKRCPGLNEFKWFVPRH